MAEYNRVRDNLKTLSAAEVLAQQITSASKVIKLSLEAIPDQLSANNIVEFYRSVHAPIYGQTIPDSGATTGGIENLGVFAASNNECYQVLAINATNGGGSSPIEVNITVGDVLIFTGPIAPNQTLTNASFPNMFPFIIAKGNDIKFQVTSGTSTDFVAAINYNQTVQN